MSQITANKHKIGKSTTTSNNFIIDASAANGTLKIERENGQPVVTIDANGKVIFPQNPGQSPTWQAVTRVGGTTYTAPDYPITLHVYALTSTNNVQGSMSINIGGTGAFVFATGGGSAVNQCGFTGTVVIPANATYVLSSSNITAGYIVKELR